MALFIFHVNDQDTGKPIKSALVSYSGRWEGFLAAGAIKGEGYTNEVGQYSFSINWGVSLHFEYTVRATGYHTVEGGVDTGTITGDYGTNVYMDKVEPLGLPPPGAGPLAELVGPIEEAFAGAGGAISGLGIQASIVLIILVIAGVIGLVALAVIL